MQLGITNEDSVASYATRILTNEDSVSSYAARIITNEDSVSSYAARILTNEDSISSYDVRLDSLEGGGGADNLGDHTATQNIQTSGNWISNDGDNEGIYIASTGNIGIGTNSTSEELIVEKNQNAATAIWIKNNDTSTGLGTWAELSVINGNSVGDGIRFMTLGENYDGAGGFRTDGGILLTETNLTGGLSLMSRTTNSNGGIRFYTNGFSDLQMIIENSGEVGINDSAPTVELDVGGDIEYTGTITDVSDFRLKKNIRNLSGPESLEKIKKIKGVSFQMKKGDGRTQLGVIAQNVKDHFPEIVSYIDNKNNYLGVDYTQLIGPMIEAMKEQQKQIEALQKEIKKLKKNK